MSDTVVVSTGAWSDAIEPAGTHPLRTGDRNPKYGAYMEGIEPAVSWQDLSPEGDIVPTPGNVLKYDEEVGDDVSVVPVPQTRRSRAKAE